MKLCRVLVLVLQAWEGQWVLVLDGVLTAAGSTLGKKGMVTRLRKWLKVYPEFGHDGPEK